MKDKQDPMSKGIDSSTSETSTPKTDVDAISPWKFALEEMAKHYDRKHKEFPLWNEMRRGFSKSSYTPAKLADLLEDFASSKWSPPPEFFEIIQRELRGERRLKRGPKPRDDAISYLQEFRLIATYEHGLIIGGRLRGFAKAYNKSQGRKASERALPTKAECAYQWVRKCLPRYRTLSNRALANEVSRLRKQESPSKKPQRKTQS